MRIDAGRNYISGDFFTGLQSDADGTAILYQDFSDRGFGANFDAQLQRGSGNGVGNGAGATAAETPRAESPINFTHVVMQQNVRGAGRANSQKRANDARSRHGGLENIGLEPLVEKIGGAHGHELHKGVALVGRKRTESLHQKVQL